MREGASPRSRRGWCGLLEALFSSSVEVCSSIGVFVFFPLPLEMAPVPPFYTLRENQERTYMATWRSMNGDGVSEPCSRPLFVAWSMECPRPCRAEATRRSYSVSCIVGLPYSLTQDMAGDVLVIV